MKALHELAIEYHVRSPAKLIGVAHRLGIKINGKEARQALQRNVGKQILAPSIPQAQGKSASEGLGHRLQADLIDYDKNTKAGGHRYALVVSDVFSREAWARPLRAKTAPITNRAMKSILKDVPGHAENAVVSTDQGGEFESLAKVLPESAVHREKDPSDYNALAVVDGTIKTLKRDLAGAAANSGTKWTRALQDVTKSYNFRPHPTVHGAPETVKDGGAQEFMVLQDQAGNFWHNRILTEKRKAALNATGAYRSRINNGNRSFKPTYGPVQKLDEILPGAGQVKDTEGNMSLLKHVLPVPKESEEPKAAVTFAPTGKKPVPRTLRVNKGKPPVAPRPAEAEPEPVPPESVPASSSGKQAPEQVPEAPKPAPSASTQYPDAVSRALANGLKLADYGKEWVISKAGHINQRKNMKESSWAISVRLSMGAP